MDQINFGSDILDSNIKKRFYLLVFSISAVFISLFLILEFGFQFSSYHVSGPGNEFVPIFRLSLLMFMLLYPFFGIITSLMITWSTSDRNQRYLISNYKSTKLVHIFLWNLIWPGVFIAIGLYLHFMQVLLDPEAFVNNDFVSGRIFWFGYFFVGRLLDPVPLMISGQWKKLTGKNFKLTKYLKFLVVNIFATGGLVILAGSVQLLAFFLGIIPISLSIIPGFDAIFPLIALVILILWPTGFFLGYISILASRAFFYHNIILKLNS